ncbi:MAG: sensor histidine kinase, partial [Caulobacter sp.]|nr:sensor histidine kinase [Caulobacter sp.]
LPGREGKAALLGDLLTVLLAPYDDQGAFAGRVRVAVPRMGVGEGTATALALVMHELATNSVKHGALSVDEGALAITSTSDDSNLFLTWAESGGPTVEGVPVMGGFGSKMIHRSLAQQFGGEIAYDWQPTGLVATIRLGKDRLAQ